MQAYPEKSLQKPTNNMRLETLREITNLWKWVSQFRSCAVSKSYGNSTSCCADKGVALAKGGIWVACSALGPLFYGASTDSPLPMMYLVVRTASEGKACTEQGRKGVVGTRESRAW